MQVHVFCLGSPPGTYHCQCDITDNVSLMLFHNYPVNPPNVVSYCSSNKCCAPLSQRMSNIYPWCIHVFGMKVNYTAQKCHAYFSIILFNIFVPVTKDQSVKTAASDVQKETVSNLNVKSRQKTITSTGALGPPLSVSINLKIRFAIFYFI